MCEEQRERIAILIVEAIWRHANKLADDVATAAKPKSHQRPRTGSNKEVSNES
jgi:hypothetical protein